MEFAEFPDYFRLMLLAARTGQAESLSERLRATAGEVTDWDEFLRVTTTHRLGGLVLQGLTQAQAPVPSRILKNLQQRNKSNAMRAIHAAMEIRRITGPAAERGLQLTVLKGVALSQAIYGNPALRHSGDLDLLVERDGDPQDAIALLGELGYRVVNPVCALTPRRFACYRRFWKDVTLEDRKTGLMLDLHWRLFNNREHRANLLASAGERREISLFGVPIRTLGANDQLLYAATHGVSDAWIYLKSLADVAAAVRGISEERLGDVLARARTMELLSQVSSAVRLAGEWFGSEVEHPLLLPASDRMHQEMRQRVLRRLTTEHFRPERSRMRASDAVRFELRLAPGLRSAMEIVSRYASRPRVWSLVDLPDEWFWLYPVLGLLLPPRGAPGNEGAGV